jgi:hypothetical protein
VNQTYGCEYKISPISDREVLKTIAQLRGNQSAMEIREECIGQIQFLSAERCHSSQSSPTPEDEVYDNGNRSDDSCGEMTSIDLSTSPSMQHCFKDKGDTSGKGSKKKKKNGKVFLQKEKRPSRNRELIAEEEKLFSALEPIDRQSIPQVEFSDTSHLQCNGILKRLRSGELNVMSQEFANYFYCSITSHFLIQQPCKLKFGL